MHESNHYTLFRSVLYSEKVYVRTGIYSSLGRRIEAIAELNELAHKDTTRVRHILCVRGRAIGVVSSAKLVVLDKKFNRIFCLCRRNAFGRAD